METGWKFHQPRLARGYVVIARGGIAFLQFAEKFGKGGRLRHCRVFEDQLSLCAHQTQNANRGAQLRSIRDKKRGGFAGSGPSKPPFAPMRGVGEGEKL